MARLKSAELHIEGYVATVRAGDIILSATSGTYDQRDERAHQRVIRIPIADAPRVEGLLKDARELAVEGGD